MGATARRAFYLVAAAGLCAGLLLPPADTASAQTSSIDVNFTFCPPKSCYQPGENFTILFDIVNVVTPGDFPGGDDLMYMVKVQNISAHFSWMAPSEYAWNDVSDNSSWLEPDGVGTEVYPLPIVIPANLTPQICSYTFRIEYQLHTAWGNITYVWGVGTTYRDFVVSEEADPDNGGIAWADYLPYISFAAIVISIGAVGAVLYHLQDKRSRRAGIASAGGVAVGEAGSGIFPVARPMPGETVTVERGFVYLVKETRPVMALSMYRGAVDGGSKGLILTREHPNRLKLVNEFSADKVAWLTRKAGKDQVDPTELSLVSLMITRFIEAHDRTVVFIEGLEYLITQNDFESVLRFVNHLHDFVLAYDSALILVVDPRVPSTREMALLERSSKVVEPVAPPAEAAPEEPAE